MNANTLPTYFPPAQYFTSLSSFTNLFIPLATIGAALIFLVMLMYAAYQYLTAGGTAENIAKAQKTMTFSVIGLIIVVVSYTLVRIIALIFRVDLPL